MSNLLFRRGKKNGETEGEVLSNEHKNEHDGVEGAEGGGAVGISATEADVSTARQSQRSSIPPRMVLRDLPLYQSKNRLAVEHNQGWNLLKLLRHDWFHVFLNIPTCRSLVFLLCIWTGMILLFASIYMAFDNANPQIDCGLGNATSPIEFGGAFAFSLETCTTVGYGLPSGKNAFFENCPGLQVVIYFQMVGHSPDYKLLCKEVYRVLKPGARIHRSGP